MVFVFAFWYLYFVFCLLVFGAVRREPGVTDPNIQNQFDAQQLPVCTICSVALALIHILASVLRETKLKFVDLEIDKHF